VPHPPSRSCACCSRATCAGRKAPGACGRTHTGAFISFFVVFRQVPSTSRLSRTSYLRGVCVESAARGAVCCAWSLRGVLRGVRVESARRLVRVTGVRRPRCSPAPTSTHGLTQKESYEPSSPVWEKSGRTCLAHLSCFNSNISLAFRPATLPRTISTGPGR
jgi:hypothetical protein